MPRALLLDHLDGRFKEAPAAFGLSNGGGLVELIATADGATWTIIVTTPQGNSCLFAAGENWRSWPRPPAAAPGPKT